jgi:serine/threonine protein kinase
VLKVGTIIAGKYYVDHFIAEGGSAEIYLAHRLKEPNSYVAIKRLLPMYNHKELFIKEVQYSLGISHQYIIKYYDFICEGDELLLIMEYIHGIAIQRSPTYLNNYNKQKHKAVTIALIYAVAQALNYLHKSKKLIHGDISGTNILITPYGQIKLLDFGSAVNINNKYNNHISYTKNYISPEQRMGKTITIASDIYSLGILLKHIASEHIHDKNIYNIYYKATTHRIAERYNNIGYLIKDLEEALVLYGICEPELLIRDAFAPYFCAPQAHNRGYFVKLIIICLVLFFIMLIIIRGFTAYFCFSLHEWRLNEYRGYRWPMG